MRLFTAEIIVRLEGDDAVPRIECNVDVEDGIPAEIITSLLPTVLRKIADDNAMANPTIVERD